jgi:hypothetical protein
MSPPPGILFDAALWKPAIEKYAHTRTAHK